MRLKTDTLPCFSAAHHLLKDVAQLKFSEAKQGCIVRYADAFYVSYSPCASVFFSVKYLSVLGTLRYAIPVRFPVIRLVGVAIVRFVSANGLHTAT